MKNNNIENIVLVSYRWGWGVCWTPNAGSHRQKWIFHFPISQSWIRTTRGGSENVNSDLVCLNGGNI